MSGGYFDYSEYKIEQIADDIQRVVISNPYRYKLQTLQRFQEAVQLLRKSVVYVKNIDYLLKSDYSEESFHEHLEEGLKEIEND
jgi:hypothetical protein